MGRVPFCGVGYRGSKQLHNKSGSGRWIAGLLPMRNLYAEPFAGLLGILLQRPPARVETVNDADGLIINWWRCVRDRADEFHRAVTLTPRSEAEFAQAKVAVDAAAGRDFSDAPADLEVGLATHIRMSQSMQMTTAAGSWGVNYLNPSAYLIPETHRLAQRLRRVQLQCRDGVAALRRIADIEDAVIYCDPPYRNMRSKGTLDYRADVSDWDELGDVLKTVRGACAVSGYAGDWDGLGWRRHELTGTVLPPQYDPEKHEGKRTEVLWTNFDPAKESGSLFG